MGLKSCKNKNLNFYNQIENYIKVKDNYLQIIPSKIIINYMIYKKDDLLVYSNTSTYTFEYIQLLDALYTCVNQINAEGIEEKYRRVPITKKLRKIMINHLNLINTGNIQKINNCLKQRERELKKIYKDNKTLCEYIEIITKLVLIFEPCYFI